MPSINDLFGTYLTAKDVPPAGCSAPVELCQLELVMGQKKLVIKLQGETKRLVVNASNAKKLAAVWGDDYTKWIGRPISVSVHQVQFMGSMVPGILLTPGAENGKIGGVLGK